MEITQPSLNVTQCPQCGSTKALANEILQKEIEKGKMPKTSRAFLFQYQSVIANPAGGWLSAPIILSFYDVCLDCGTVYCTHAEVRTAVPGGRSLPKSGGQFSTS